MPRDGGGHAKQREAIPQPFSQRKPNPVSVAQPLSFSQPVGKPYAGCESYAHADRRAIAVSL